MELSRRKLGRRDEGILTLSSHVARSSLLVVGLEPSRRPWRRRVPGTRTFRVLISNPGRRPMAPCPPPCFPASWWPSDATRGGTSERRAETRPKNGGGKRKGGGERGESESVRGGRGRERRGVGSAVEATSVVVVRGARHKYVCIIRCDLPHYPTRSDSCFITMSTLPRPVPFLRSPFKWMARNRRVPIS